MSADDPPARIEKRRFPLQLHEVLEQEFVVIRGAPPLAPGWLLEPHDISLGEFIDHLKYPSQHLYSSAIHAVHDKLVRFGFKMPESEARDVLEACRRSAIEKLNRLLTSSEDLYDPRLLGPNHKVRHLAELRNTTAPPPGPQTRATGDLGTTAAAGDGVDKDKAVRESASDEQVQLNRLLLEAAFSPAAIARIETVRLGRAFKRLHALQRPDDVPSALCLSGGGIRSASFSLGVLQGLARCGALEKFDYLSTVSGGGYLGSWFSTWVQRHPAGLAGVVSELKAHTQSEAGGGNRLLAPEAAPIRFLRSYSHFLNPRSGLLSVDTWTWVGIYLRNLSLNWLVLIPLLLILVSVPRLYAAALYSWQIEHFQAFFWLGMFAITLTLICVTVNRPSISEPATTDARALSQRGVRLFDRLRARWSKELLIVAFGIAPLALFSLLMALFVWVAPEFKTPTFTGIDSFLAALPNMALEHLVVWGELIVLVAWGVSMVILPAQPWPKRLVELGAMWLAGCLAWFIVARFLGYFSHYNSSPEPIFTAASFSVYRFHLYSVIAAPSIVLAVLAGMTVFIGIVSKYPWIDDEDREWWARFGAWALIAVVSWIALAAISIFGPMLLLESPRLVSAVGGTSGLLAVLLGKSSLSPANNQKSALSAEQKRKLLERLGPGVLALCALLFLAAFLSFLSLLVTALLKYLMSLSAAASGGLAAYIPSVELSHACGLGEPWKSWWQSSTFSSAGIHSEIACQTPFSLIMAVTLAWASMLWVAGLLVNLNKFSLHAAYRIRIVRTFLGASRREERKPNPFTGFDPLDNVQMHDLQPGLLRESDILDLPRFVDQLRTALDNKKQLSHAWLVGYMCDRDIDKFGVLQSRLRVSKPSDVILKSLQQDIIEKLNRVLEASRLDSLAPFTSLLGTDAKGDAALKAVRKYVVHGNYIFANRLLLEAAFPDVIRRYDFPPPPPHKLVHVLNLTLNLVHGRQLAWQERKAAPFVVTPMHSGSYYLGYRQSRDYGGGDGISIGTAAAISGAAVSPNMGYSSSPITALLLTLFNVRLGWWLGNPGVAGATTWSLAEPKFSVRPLISEALGLTDDRNPYVYLSDGGHFENMGLFEMVLRRCRIIVATDAGADPKYQFDDLGNALRKIRIDLGIEIDFETLPIHKRKNEDDKSGRYCAVGRIQYSRIDGAGAPDGVLIVFKPVLRGNEPIDVSNYAAQNPSFPQEPTIDQFFGESQFESYRQLGEFAVEAACTPRPSADPSGPWAVRLVEATRDHLGAPYTDKDSWLNKWLEDAKTAGVATKREPEGNPQEV